MNGRSPAQSALPGFDENPVPLDRLFFAIFPDPTAAARIDSLSRRVRGAHGLTGQIVSADRLHVTLHHLGDFLGVPPDVVNMAREAAAQVKVPAFEVSFDHVMSFASGPDKQPLVMRSHREDAALMALQAALAVAMRRAGFRSAKPGFTPHVTLSYENRLVVEQAVEPLSWTVSEFRLTHSLLGAGVHTTLGSWPLFD